MAKLYDRNIKINLEVKDNNIYFYSNIKEISQEDYAKMLDTLVEAYHELKM